MSSLELELYELLKPKLGDKETRALLDLVENKVDSKKEELATKLEIEKLRATTMSEIEKLRATTISEIEKLRAETKLGMEKIKAELLVIKWMLGVVMAGIVSLILKTFFA